MTFLKWSIMGINIYLLIDGNEQIKMSNRYIELELCNAYSFPNLRFPTF